MFKRGDDYWLDVRHGDTRTRKSAKTTDKDTAEDNARALAREIARQDLFGVTPDSVRLGPLFTAYQEKKGATLEGQWKKASESRQRLFLAVWGADLPVASISQTNVDAFSIARRKAWLAKQRKREVPKPKPLRDGALDCDFRWLSSVFNWATRHKLPDGKRLLTLNPLHDCKWPRERRENIRRPVQSQERYEKTLTKADAIEPSGRFRLALVLARHTGRRIDAILNLSASDILLTKDRITARLAALGRDVRDGKKMPHGAIHWRAANDKRGIDRVTPIAEDVKAELEAYLKAHPRVGDVPLFPASKDPDKAIDRGTATKWLEHAEQLAKLPKLAGGLWHAYRRLWANERKDLPDVDVADAGGWTGTKALRLVYQQASPDGVLAAVTRKGA